MFNYTTLNPVVIFVLIIPYLKRKKINKLQILLLDGNHVSVCKIYRLIQVMKWVFHKICSRQIEDRPTRWCRHITAYRSLTIRLSPAYHPTLSYQQPLNSRWKMYDHHGWWISLWKCIFFGRTLLCIIYGFKVNHILFIYFQRFQHYIIQIIWNNSWYAQCYF